LSKLQNYSAIFRKTVNHHLSTSLTPLDNFTPLDFIFLPIAVQTQQQANTTGLDFELKQNQTGKHIANCLSFWLYNMKLKETNYKNNPKNITLL